MELSPTWERSFLESKWTLGVVSLLTIVFFSISNLPWQLDEYSQERQALASFGVVKEGRWLYQHAPRDREATKPPLMPWISAGLFETTRSWDFAWRFPSFVAAISLALLLFRAGTKAFGAIGGLFALSAFSLNMLSPRLATLVRTDMPLALVAFLIGLRIWQKIEKQEAWEQRDRWMMFTLLTVALFLKGPIIYLFLLPGIVAFQWRGRKAGSLYPTAWCGWWPWAAPLGIFLVWVIGGIVSQPGFFDQVVMHEFLGRLSTAEQRPHPPYYYVAHLMQKFAPWSELLLVLAAISVGASRGAIRESWRKISPGTFWLICWSLGGLIVMSMIPSKRIDRIYPMIPPLCLLLAAQITRASEHLRRRFYQWGIAALVLSMLLAGHYVIYKKVYLGYRNHRDAFSNFGREVRLESQARHWRYEVVESHDGGMLLYLEKAHFIDPDRAIAEWNAGKLDALVVRTQQATDLMPNLPGATLSPIKTDAVRADRGRGYVVIVRSTPSDPAN